VNLAHELTQDSRIVVVYDGDCPLCNSYVHMTRLSKAVGRPTLVNARERPELIKALAESGINLDEGMAVYYQGRLYVGSEAVNLLALLTTPVDLANRITAAVLARPALARALYPLLRAGRNLLLKLRNRPQLTR
jgi:predicted DCC family thiol-disulfide oxidoreductase YuxK